MRTNGSIGRPKDTCRQRKLLRVVEVRQVEYRSKEEVILFTDLPLYVVIIFEPNERQDQ
jgi:hypothetical protein